MKFICKSEEDLGQVVGQVLDASARSDPNKAFVLGLYGDLGSGKTTFTKYLAKAFNLREEITSPTFIIQNRFEIPGHDRFKNLFHLDVYRIDSEKELEVLGFKDVINNPENIVIVEWPERVETIIPEDTLKLQFTFVDDSTREVEIRRCGEKSTDSESSNL